MVLNGGNEKENYRFSDSPYEKSAKDRINKAFRAQCLILLSIVSIHCIF